MLTKVGGGEISVFVDPLYLLVVYRERKIASRTKSLKILYAFIFAPMRNGLVHLTTGCSEDPSD